MPTFSQIVQRLAPSAEFHQSRYARTLGEIVAPGELWLDIGAGALLHNSSQPPTPTELAVRAGCVVGIDFEVGHLARNRVLTSRVGGSGNTLPFRNQQFTLVSANMVLEHLDRPEEFFAEVARVLRPGGKFLFVTPHRNHPAIRVASLIFRPSVQRQLAHRLEGRELEHIFPTWYRANTVAQVHRLAGQVGLKVVQLDVFQSIPFIQRPLVLTALECLVIRALDVPPLRRFGSNLLGILQRPSP